MREIKFRAWDKKLKKMFYDVRIDFGGGAIFIRKMLKGTAPIFNNPDKKEGIPMQYTGLKDKNGKEIYEGDIIKHDYYYDYGQSGEYKNFTKCVVWDDLYCGFKPMYATGEYLLPRNSIEVIGNIHENPELLDK